MHVEQISLLRWGVLFIKALSKEEFCCFLLPLFSNLQSKVQLKKQLNRLVCSALACSILQVFSWQVYASIPSLKITVNTVFLKSMQFNTMKSHPEQLRTCTEIKSVKERNSTSFVGQYLEEVRLFTKDLSIRCCLLPGIAAPLKTQNSHMHGSATCFCSCRAAESQTIALISKQHVLRYMSQHAVCMDHAFVFQDIPLHCNIFDF